MVYSHNIECSKIFQALLSKSKTIYMQPFGVSNTCTCFLFVCLFFFYFSLVLLIYVKLYKTNKSGGICLFTLNSSSVYNTRITVHRRKPRYLSPSSKRRTQIPWLAMMITVGKPANSDLLLTGEGVSDSIFATK